MQRLQEQHPVVKKAAKNAVGVYQIVEAARVAETPGAAPVVKEAGNVVEASQSRAANLAIRITVEGANEPEQLNEIFEFKEALTHALPMGEKGGSRNSL